MRTFLLVNGYQVAASQNERFRWMLRLSEGATADDLAEWIRSSLKPT